MNTIDIMKKLLSQDFKNEEEFRNELNNLCEMEDKIMKLKNWNIIKNYEHKNVYQLDGKIFDDEKKRFADGADIITSRLLSIDFENRIAKTKNSTYILDEEDTI